MSDYLRAGKSIGIIGGDTTGLMLGMQAKIMGFEVNLLDPDPTCPAKKIANHYIQADYNDLSGIERLDRLSDVITYTVTNLDVDMLAQIENEINLPQAVDLLALTQDRLLLKGFLEECGVNVLPYATIVQMTDIEEKIDGIGYPCYLSTTGNEERVYLNDPSDLFNAFDLVKQGTCLLESSLSDVRHLSLTIARNEEQIATFPVVEHIYKEERLLETIAVRNYLDEDLQEEIYRLGRLIAEKLENSGVITIEFLLTDTGLIFVDNIIPTINNESIFTKDACVIDVFEAHLRSIANWPLINHNELKQDTITYHVVARELTFMQRQIQQQPNWKFYFYQKEAYSLSTEVANITVIVQDFETDLNNLNQIMK